MTKTVNIQATIPVRTLAYPICGVIKNIEMEVGDIFKCICGRAFVDEILSDGTLVRLGMENYNKDNETQPVEFVEEPPAEVVPPAEEFIEDPAEEAPLAPVTIPPTAPVEEVVVEDETPAAVEVAGEFAEEEALPDTKVIVEEVPVNHNNNKK